MEHAAGSRNTGDMPDQDDKYRVGLDIGGTFTDVVLEGAGRRLTAKVLTTLDDPSLGCMKGLDEVLAEGGISPDDIGVIIHGTTLATNAIIERKGATTSLVTTDGFRDTIEMGTEGRPEQYDINIIKPEPLVPRRRRFTVPERLNARGEALVPLTEDSLETLLPALDAANTESVAVAFVHAYVNPVHEIMVRDYIRSRRPDWSISISSEVSPEFREFERFSTTCANAYVQPGMARYLEKFESRLKEAGYDSPLLLMLSSGGLTTVETARKFPVRLVESGPAGGAIFAGEIAKSNNMDKVVSFDMGGTTAKICLVDGGRAQSSRRFEVARVYRFRKDSGIPLRIPVIEMVEIGAGGGSIAWMDELGRISVGPRSAGSNPGPACYGQGATEPTITDANLLLGAIDPDNFAGGKLKLDRQAAASAIEKTIGIPMNVPPANAAFGVTETVCENMASAARVHAIESGKNVDDRTLIAFGGGAPLHACRLAEKLGISKIVIPRNAGVGSAVGFLRAPVSYEVVRTFYQQMESFDAGRVNDALKEMQDEAEGYVRLGGGPASGLDVRRQAYMRYCGQGHEIVVDVPDGVFDKDAGNTLKDLFDERYAEVFGRNMKNIVDAEVVAWSVTVSTASRPDNVAAGAFSSASGPKPECRKAFDPATLGLIDHAVYVRDELPPDAEVPGPARIFEDATSTLVGSSFSAKIVSNGAIELSRRAR